ncbi:DUF2933 domain-containing protein [Undibacterium sp. RTI2.1]|uniref:DUF2933 domain-containing protein n=1 Tax=unclassified Undibacterium TaxID=2630295 RepID=UPI002B237DF2|nr:MULTISPECIES: DUF2933 domain-containing protein [unclassified Undibacterium]MEB0033202.1 DUF2933 domain-containing protein [Undibacterium sp. RTI2.1]MEB0118288.1 DUF2933 domain-containing protein [Undibacterium sp. RTI2.2]
MTAYLLIWGHRVHLDSYLHYLPFLLLIACSAMHFFMHSGDHGHHQHAGQKDISGDQK